MSKKERKSREDYTIFVQDLCRVERRGDMMSGPAGWSRDMDIVEEWKRTVLTETERRS